MAIRSPNSSLFFSALTACFLFLLYPATVLSTPFSDNLKQKALNDAFANTFTQVFEAQVGVPASSLAQMSGQFSGGDYSGGLFKAVEIVGDTVTGKIPVISQLVFMVKLEAEIIKLGKVHLDTTMVDKFWDVFQELEPQAQQDFINGEHTAQIEDALGGYYTQRNVEDLRDLFGYYLHQKEAQKNVAEHASQLLKDLSSASLLMAPAPYSPSSGSRYAVNEIDPLSFAFNWHTSTGNLFMVEIVVNGQTIKSPVGKFLGYYQPKLNWEQILGNKDSVEVKWRVWGARTDTTGLVKSYLGENFVTTGYNIIQWPGKELVMASPWQTFTVAGNSQLEVVLNSPQDNFETGSDKVSVSAQVSSETGIGPGDIQAVGFVINGTVKYAALNNNAFSIEAPLNVGSNQLQAGILTGKGNYVLSDTITVTRTQQQSQAAWVLREIVPRDLCADYSHQCYDLKYVMGEGSFSQNGNGKSGGPCYCDVSGNCGPWSGSGGYTVPPAVLFPGEEIDLSVEVSGTENRGYAASMEYCLYDDADDMSFDGRGYNTGDQPDYCRGRSFGMPYLWPDGYPTPILNPQGSMTIPVRSGGGLVIDGSFRGSQCKTGYRYAYEWTDNYSEPTKVEDYYPTGGLKSIYTWRDGLQNGPATRYHENGQIAAQATYLNGVPEGTARYYYADGTREKVANYKNGKANGPAYYYDQNGDLHAMISYVDEVKHGPTQEYYPDGNLKREYTYVNGRVEGKVIEYAQDGSITNEYDYSDVRW